ncbi:MAG TPA: transcriptional repressor LexA [Lacunisphaera sp.]|nr:transcriptional repressor LexA [Lacunisphaera sp.]
MRAEMTENQTATLDFIGVYQEMHGAPPSVREIQRHFGLSSHTTIVRQLHALAEAGHVEQLPNGSWGLKGRQTQLHFALPVYGEIPAGMPAMREQESLETLSIDPRMFGVKSAKPNQFWGLRVKGDSMTNAAILDGDVVLLARREAKPGDIIAALVDDTEVTLKRLVRERGRTFLRAENPRYPDLHPRKIESQGVMVGVIRRA